MTLALLSLLRIGSGHLSGVLADAVDCSLEPVFTSDSVAAGEFSEDASDGELPAWTPEPSLRVDRDGSWISAPPSDAGEKPLWIAPPGMGDSLFEDGRGTGPVWQSAIRAILEPLDLLCRWENVQAAYEKGFADLSVTTSLPVWIDSWGCALGTHSLLSVSFDMLGFEDFEGSDPVILDSHHGTARLNYVSSAISFSLKF